MAGHLSQKTYQQAAKYHDCEKILPDEPRNTSTIWCCIILSRLCLQALKHLLAKQLHSPRPSESVRNILGGTRPDRKHGKQKPRDFKNQRGSHIVFMLFSQIRLSISWPMQGTKIPIEWRTPQRWPAFTLCRSYVAPFVFPTQVPVPWFIHQIPLWSAERSNILLPY